MNGIERVLNTINHVAGGPVPRGELVIDRDFMEAFFKWRGNKMPTTEVSYEKMLIECCRILKLDLVCIQSEEFAPGYQGVSNPKELIERIRNAGLFVFWIVNGAFQTEMGRRGFMECMKRIAMAPESIFMDMQKKSRQVISVLEFGVSTGANGIILADDIAYQKSSYMAPDFGKKYLLPLWQEQVAAAKRHNTPIFFHSDGNINSFLPIIAAAGFDGIQCLEPAAGMDIAAVKKMYGKKLCLMGNIDPSLLVDFNKSNSCVDATSNLSHAVKHLMANAAPGGGFIFGTCSGLSAGISPEKVNFMFELASRIDAAYCDSMF